MVRLGAAVVLWLVASGAARGDIIWRAHCDFNGKGRQPTEASFDTSRECTEVQAAAVLLKAQQCQAGDQEACSEKVRLMRCTCVAEKVQ